MCDACKQTCEAEPAWTEEDKQAEALALFGSLMEGPKAVVCDDCWHAMGFGGDEVSA